MLFRSSLYCLALAFSTVLVPARAERPATIPADTASCRTSRAELESFVGQTFGSGIPFAEARSFSRCPWAATFLLELLKKPSKIAYADNIVFTLGMMGRIDAIDGLIDFLEAGDAAQALSDQAYQAKSDVLIALGCILNQIDLELQGRDVERINPASAATLEAAREHVVAYLRAGLLDPSQWSRIGWKGPFPSDFDRNIYLTKKTVMGLSLSGDRKVQCYLDWTKEHLEIGPQAGLLVDRCGFKPAHSNTWGREHLAPRDLVQLQRLLDDATALNSEITKYPRGLADYYGQTPK
jgi:hypothetical protein